MNYKIVEYPIIISESDIDENGHVNNITYLKWVQDVATAHWLSVSNKEQQEQNLWVVNRHEIDYLKQAYLNSHLIAKTWVTKPNGAKSERHVVIYDKDHDNIVANIITTWYLLDGKTKRPKRISEELANIFLRNSN